MIDLTVKTLDSQNHSFSLEDDQITVRRFKEHIAESVAVPADSQRLIYCGRVLQDEKKLNDYDVNGKVIHLVQSAPPHPGQRTNDSAHGQGQQAPGWQNQQRAQYRFSHGQIHGNAMYLGAMSVPPEVVEGHGIPVPQLSNSLSSSRLIVANCMLSRANELMDRLDDPTAPLHPSTSENNQAPLAQQIQVQEIVTEETGDGRQPTGSRLPEDVIDALVDAFEPARRNNVPLMRGNNDDPYENRTSSETQEDAEMESPSASQNDQQGTSNTDDQFERRLRVQLPRPPQMAYLLRRLLRTQDRLRPYIDRYRALMFTDRSLPPGAGAEGADESQRIVDGVSECLHYISHSCHALSDIIVDMRQQPPRNLRCRPIIIQHSAILQAGVPIQVEAHISLHGRNANNNNGNEETAESTNAPQPADIVVASGSIEVTTEDNNQSQESNSTPSSQPTEQQRPQEPSQSQAQQSQSQSQFVFDLPNNVGVLMEVSPDSNMDATPGSEQNQTGESNNNNNAGRTGGGGAGIFPWDSAPTPDFLRNLMQAVAGHVMQGGIATAPITTRTTVTTAGVQQTTATTMDSTSANAAQSTQARSNVGTHPTTATQTRSTSRPHVFQQHPAPSLGVGMSMGQGLEFDPFLPCNSHHVRRTPTSTPNVTTTSQSTRANQTPAQETQPQAQTATTSTASSTSSTSTTPPTSSAAQGAANNPIMNLFQQMLGDSSEQQQTSININGNSPDLAESFGNIMQMLGNGNIHIGIMGDGGANVFDRNLTLHYLLERGGLRFHENDMEEDEDLVTELALIVARFITLEDLIRLRLGRWEPIARLRAPLRVLFCMMDNSSSPEERDEVVERLIAPLRPHLRQLSEREEDATGRSGSRIDISATVVSILSRHYRDMLRLVIDDDIDNRRFGQEISSIVNNLGRQVCAVLRYSLRGGQAGLEAVATRFVSSMLDTINPSFRQWVLNSFIAHFRAYTLRIPQPPDSEILPLLVYKDATSQTSASSTVPPQSSTGSTKTQQSQSQPQPQPQPQQQQQQPQPQSQPTVQQQQQQQQQQHEPMETEVVEEKSNTEVAAIPDDGEDIPETFPGHEELPSEWIPIIARDGVRQRRQLQMQGMANGTVTTFSDAYLSGLPTKRRKLIEKQKPRLLVSPTPNHSAITASVERLVREGVSRAGIEEVDGAAVAVATDPGVRRAFGQAIRDCLNPHRCSTPDFPDPLRFPNATKYFADQGRSSK